MHCLLLGEVLWLRFLLLHAVHRRSISAWEWPAGVHVVPAGPVPGLYRLHFNLLDLPKRFERSKYWRIVLRVLHLGSVLSWG